ncbi:hypothetical protein PC110_g21952, partial [Phytophthora cactorum]
RGRRSNFGDATFDRSRYAFAFVDEYDREATGGGFVECSSLQSRNVPDFKKPQPVTPGDEAQQATTAIKVKRGNQLTRHDEEETAREKHRLSQQRYRQKQYDLAVKLEKDTCRLREEVKMLENKRRAVLLKAPGTDTAVWVAAIEYFRLFRHGLPSSGPDSVAESIPCVQLAFAQATMAPDVVHNSGVGVEAMMRSWRRLSNWFEDAELELDRLEKGIDGSIVATTITSITINETTVRYVFPQLHDSGGISRKRRSTQKLLGQRIVMHGVIRFEWDSGFGRLTSLVGHSDLLTPVLQLLGNVEDACFVFEKSLARPDFG